MKRFFGIIMLLIITIGICSCNFTPDHQSESNNAEKTYETTSSSKENVDDFFNVAKEIEGTGLLSGCDFDNETCFNVTPEQVLRETDYKIFKFSDSCTSFIMIDNEIYILCASFGGYGFVNAVPCDFNNDGIKDLLVASSWGSGLHRSIISVFNAATKESTVVYDTSTTDNPSVDLIVASPASSDTLSDLPIYYQVYTAEIQINNGNFADLSYAIIDLAGSISTENGQAVFTPHSK